MESGCCGCLSSLSADSESNKQDTEGQNKADINCSSLGVIEDGCEQIQPTRAILHSLSWKCSIRKEVSTDFILTEGIFSCDFSECVLGLVFLKC